MNHGRCLLLSGILFERMTLELFELIIDWTVNICVTYVVVSIIINQCYTFIVRLTDVCERLTVSIICFNSISLNSKLRRYWLWKLKCLLALTSILFFLHFSVNTGSRSSIDLGRARRSITYIQSKTWCFDWFRPLFLFCWVASFVNFNYIWC